MRKREYLAIVFAFLGALAYLVVSASRSTIGFALDDAWIHQVYARNLGVRGEFSFFPGLPSAGSTAPLWTLVLALGYPLQFDFRIWTMIVGALLTGLGALLAVRVAGHVAEMLGIRYDCTTNFVIPGCILLEWHLAWGAVSGMEIPLFVMLSLLLIELFWDGWHGWIVGLVAGLLALTRPEGLVFGALVFLGFLLRGRSERGFGWRLKPLTMGGYLVGLLIVLFPYLVFNYAVSGTVLPNTFYAKSAEYAELLDRAPFASRWLELELVPWIGAQVLLLPGFLYACVRLIRRREWSGLLPIVWMSALGTLYAARLPVAYQHGRYEMPLIPFVLIYGVLGTRVLMDRIKHRILTRVWAMSATVLMFAFWVIGANAYATDVAIIDCEMVQTAKWISTNAPSSAVVAAHDIGALGFYFPRPVVDMAGLVSSDVIQFMRDQVQLREYLISKGVTHAIFFPDWYPALANDASFRSIRQQNCPTAREAGGTDMIIYQIVADSVQ